MRAALALIMLAGCADPAPPRGPVPVALAGGEPIRARPLEADSNGTLITLLAPGAEPRRELRYHPAPASRQASTLDYEMSARIEPDTGGSLPVGRLRMTGTVAIDVVEVDSEGMIRVRIHVVAIEQQPLDEGGKLLAQGAGGLSPADNVFMARLDPQGDVIERPQMPLGARQFADLRYSVVPLPRQAVGPGARWRVRRAMPDAFDMIEDTEWELVAWDGPDGAVFRCVQRLRQRRDRLGGNVENMDFTNTWEGMRVGFGGVLPTAATTTSKSSFRQVGTRAMMRIEGSGRHFSVPPPPATRAAPPTSPEGRPTTAPPRPSRPR